MKKIFRKKPINDLLLKSGNMQLPKTMGSFDLIMLGVGAIVGTGIFILPGTVSALHAGPGDCLLLYDCCSRLCISRAMLF